MIELLEFKHLIFEHISYGSKLDNIILLSSKLLNSKICYSNIKHNNIHSIDFKEIDSLIKLLVMDDFLLSNEIYNKFNNNIKKINYVNYNDIYIFPILYNKSLTGYLYIKSENIITQLNYYIYLAQVCGIVVSINESNKYNNKEKTLNNFLNDLISNKVSGNDFNNRIINTNTSRFDKFKLIALATQKDKFEIYEALINDIEYSDLKLFIHKDNLLLLIDKTISTKDLNNLYSTLNNKYGLIIYISDSFDDLYEISKAYLQIETSLYYSKYITNDTYIFYYDDFKILESLGSLSFKDKIKSICNAYYNIQIYDEINSTEYLKTIRYYIRYNKSINKTCEYLFIHKNTLSYRFKRIKELFEFDIDNYNHIFKIQYAFKIIDLSSNDINHVTYNK